MSTVTFALLLAFASGSAAQQRKPPGDVPVGLWCAPFAIAADKPTKIKLRGLKLDGLVEVRCDLGATAKIVGKPAKVAAPTKELTPVYGDTVVELELSVPKDAAGEFVTLVPVSFGGPGRPLRVIVDRVPVPAEKEPNDGFAQAQSLGVPATIDGKIQTSLDVDVYRLDLAAGQSVSVEVVAARLGVPLDPRLTLYDARGQELAANDDAEGRDPKLEFVAPRAGAYFVAVGDALDAGGDTHAYRLRVK